MQKKLISELVIYIRKSRSMPPKKPEVNQKLTIPKEEIATFSHWVGLFVRIAEGQKIDLTDKNELEKLRNLQEHLAILLHTPEPSKKIVRSQSAFERLINDFNVVLDPKLNTLPKKQTEIQAHIVKEYFDFSDVKNHKSGLVYTRLKNINLLDKLHDICGLTFKIYKDQESCEQPAIIAKKQAQTLFIIYPPTSDPEVALSKVKIFEVPENKKLVKYIALQTLFTAVWASTKKSN